MQKAIYESGKVKDDFIWFRDLIKATCEDGVRPESLRKNWNDIAFVKSSNAALKMKVCALVLIYMKNL